MSNLPPLPTPTALRRTDLDDSADAESSPP
jgi:hypothetical protein